MVSHTAAKARQSTAPCSPIPMKSVLELFDHLDDPGRELPVVLVSIRSRAERPSVPVHRLARDLAGRATVWVLPSADGSRQLDARPEYATYGGAVRVIGADGWSTVIRTDTNEKKATGRIAHTVSYANKRIHAAHGSAQEVKREQPLPDGEARPALGAVERQQLHQLRGQVVQLQEQVARLRLEIRDRQLSVSSCRAEADEAAGEAWPIVFEDDEDQLRWEIEQSWLRQVAEPDRTTFPLRSFQLGQAFLDGLRTVNAPRARVVGVIVDVLTRRAYDMAARNVHPHTAKRGGTQVVRTDKAAAFRCVVKDSTPGAPRLLWFELVDGTVELAWVGHHDDRLPRASLA